MLRMVAGLIILGCAATPALSQSISFDDAKKGDEAKKLAYLDQLLGKLVWDKEKNPAGCVKAWYYMAGTDHKDAGCHCGKCAQAALKEEFKRDGRENYFDKEMPALLKAMESPAGRIFPFYRETAPMAQKKNQGIILVGDLFGLQDQEELSSTMEDYLLPYLKHHEQGMAFKDGDNELELNPAIPILRDIAHMSLLNMYSRAGQIEKIAAKARKVSDGFRQAVVKNYLDSLKLYLRQFKKELKIFDDNNENTLQKEIVDFLTFMKDLVFKNLKKAGLEHKEVNKETFEFSLEGI